MYIKNLLKTTAAVATLFAGSQSWGATWTDVTDSTAHNSAGTFNLTDGHLYRPTNAGAWSGTVTLPNKAKAVVGAASVASFAGNNYTVLTVEGSGELTLYGSDGATETISSLVKAATGSFIINDRTSGGLTISGATLTAPAKFSDITIKTYGVNTTLTLPNTIGWADAKINVDAFAKITLSTLTSCPYLLGEGTITLPALMTTIPFSRIKGFKGKLITGAVVTVDYSK